MFPYDSCFINTAKCFIHALYDLRLNEINSIIKIFIHLLYPFHSSIPNPCDIVSERAITHIVSKVLVLSCYSDSLNSAQVARPMRDTMRGLFPISPYFLVQILSSYFSPQELTQYSYLQEQLFCKSCNSINCIYFSIPAL